MCYYIKEEFSKKNNFHIISKFCFFNNFILLYFKPSLFVSKIENNTELLTN